MGLDALASSAYGPEAALSVLAPLGAQGVANIGVVMAPIIVLLGILYASYWQTIGAYPTNGGAYAVAKDNLGTTASLVAAAALMTDYVLNVSVGISAGVGALTSALPILHPHTLSLCLVILATLTVVNLRGTLDAGRLWAVPTYLFIGSFMVLLAIGTARAVVAGGHPQPISPPPMLPEATQALSLWLLTRAFANGCTAMTGVEAVSNGVGAFRDPAVSQARRTLTGIVGALTILLIGIAYLSRAYRIGAMDQTQDNYQSVLSQLASAIVGHDVFYHVAIGSALCVLCLSAGTSFVAFPRMCRVLAVDGFLPRAFAIPGRRLVFTVGIVYLAAAAGTLIIVFGGITDRLIPLFAIGAFLGFTLSQAGMVVHWRREQRKGRQARSLGTHARLATNAIGTAATAAVLVVIILTKLTEGAWIVVIVVPLVTLLLTLIKRYYSEFERQLRGSGPIELAHSEPPVILVTIDNWNLLANRAVSLALQLSPDVAAVHFSSVTGGEAKEVQQQFRRKWAEEVEEPARRLRRQTPRLIFLETPFRRIREPLWKLLQAVEREFTDRPIAVLIPEIVKSHWWQHFLHTRRARRLRRILLRYDSSRLLVISIPWQLQ